MPMLSTQTTSQQEEMAKSLAVMQKDKTYLEMLQEIEGSLNTILLSEKSNWWKK